MDNFKSKLTEKYISHFDNLIESVASVEYENLKTPITHKKHIDIIIKYVSHMTEKTEADLMDLYSSSLFSVNNHDSHSEKIILETTDDLLDHQKIVFTKRFSSCFESLKKAVGHIYSNDALKKSIVVNTGTRLEMAKDEFEHWSESLKGIKKDNEYDKELN